ncbi:hypothetical protein ADL27_08450 [Streptomyces sp. NRRL F-6602]|nr:hypothetical protein ADL27_08450 [Streptomyces sp. NRRL F-6602]
MSGATGATGARGFAEEAEAFAELLRRLKERSGLSYGALAKRLHTSTSTLHRYCNGSAVPADYAPVERLARVCRATPDELVELHRRWILADAARGRRAAPGTRGATSGDGTGQPKAPPAPVEPTTGAGGGPARPEAPGDGLPGSGEGPAVAGGLLSGAGETRDVPGNGAHPAAGGPPVPGDGPNGTSGSQAVPADGLAKTVGKQAVPDDGPHGTAGEPAVPGDIPSGAADGAEAAPGDDGSGGRGAPEASGEHARPDGRDGHGAPGRNDEQGRPARSDERGHPARPDGRRALTGSDGRGGTGLLDGRGEPDECAGPDGPARPDGPDRSQEPVVHRTVARAPVRSRRRRTLLVASVAAAVLGAVALTVQLPATRGDVTGKQAAEVTAPATGARSGPGRAHEARPPVPFPSPSRSRSASGGGSAAPTPKSGAEDGRSAARRGGGAPVNVAVRPYVYESPCSQHFLVDGEPEQVGPPAGEQDAPRWAAAYRAVSSGEQRVALTVQGTGKETVVLEALHVRVVSKGAPLAWNDYSMGVGCGGNVETKSFGVDLDNGSPTVTVRNGQRDFPYKVSESDPEVFYVTARTKAHDVRWDLTLDWSSGDRRGTVHIDNNGSPFRTSADAGRPGYDYPLGGSEWIEREE